MGRVGRPREDGERYPSGKLKQKPTGFAIAPAAWARIRVDMVKLSGDTRLASEVGRLSFHRLITDKQAATAFRIGEIYGAFERHKRKRRTTKSPSYEMGFGGDGIAEELMDAEELEQLEARIIEAESAFLALDEHLTTFPRAARAAIEQLCIDDCAINSMYLRDIGRLLDNVATFLLENTQSAKKKRRRKAKVRPPAPTPVATPARRADHEMRSWLSFMHTVRPDLDTAGLQAAYDIFSAMKDRGRFARAPDKPVDLGVKVSIDRPLLKLPT